MCGLPDQLIMGAHRPVFELGMQAPRGDVPSRCGRRWRGRQRARRRLRRRNWQGGFGTCGAKAGVAVGAGPEGAEAGIEVCPEVGPAAQAAQSLELPEPVELSQENWRRGFKGAAFSESSRETGDDAAGEERPPALGREPSQGRKKFPPA